MERIVGSLTVVDPLTAEVKIAQGVALSDLSGVLTTAGGIVVTAMLDGHHRRLRRPDPR